jgi:hypothetical protein
MQDNLTEISYVWDLVPGPAFCLVRRQLLTLGMEQLSSSLTRRLDSFASTWINRPAIKQLFGLLDEYSRMLDQISQAGRGLPRASTSLPARLAHGSSAR